MLTQPRVIPSLTPRERQVHDLIIQGCNRREVALELGISKETVRNHAQTIYRKTGTFNQLDLIMSHYDLPRWKNYTPRCR